MLAWLGEGLKAESIDCDLKFGTVDIVLMLGLQVIRQNLGF